MTSIMEMAGRQGQLSAATQSALDAVDKNQEVSFQQYQRVVLSQDGTVFWSPTNQWVTVKGSLHYSTDRTQQEDQTIGLNQVIFTAEKEITEFNVIAPDTMWIGVWPVANNTATLDVAFSKRGLYYKQANAWHYTGFTVYPALKSQIIQSAADLPTGPIVSNSLPIWLSQNSLAPVYPSFLVPDNAAPPYIAAHIEPNETEALQDFAVFTWPGVTESNSGASPLHDLPSTQLMRDRVRLTLYGFTNQTAIQYLVALQQYSLDTDDFGFMNRPAIHDEKRTQVEIAALAQKKTIEIIASYYQATADAIARRLILSATLTVTPQAA